MAKSRPDRNSPRFNEEFAENKRGSPETTKTVQLMPGHGVSLIEIGHQVMVIKDDWDVTNSIILCRFPSPSTETIYT